MTHHSQTSSACGDAWQRGFAAAAILFLLAALESAHAGDPTADSIWTETYAGLFIGSGLTRNRLADVDGFANWGHPGWISEYDDQGFAWGALAGSRFEFAGTPLRLEVDATFGDLSATSDQLDPQGRDETALADFQWVATARAGIEDRLGGVTLFATGGLAAARIDNSVTDIDFSPGMPPRMDPDDSFRDSSTHLGWAIGIGIETALSDDWTLRLDGSYLDFGRKTFYVNESGNDPCGPGGPRSACPYRVENSIGILRLGLVRRFGP